MAKVEGTSRLCQGGLLKIALGLFVLLLIPSGVIWSQEENRLVSDLVRELGPLVGDCDACVTASEGCDRCDVNLVPRQHPPLPPEAPRISLLDPEFKVSPVAEPLTGVDVVVVDDRPTNSITFTGGPIDSWEDGHRILIKNGGSYNCLTGSPNCITDPIDRARWTLQDPETRGDETAPITFDPIDSPPGLTTGSVACVMHPAGKIIYQPDGLPASGPPETVRESRMQARDSCRLDVSALTEGDDPSLKLGDRDALRVWLKSPVQTWKPGELQLQLLIDGQMSTIGLSKATLRLPDTVTAGSWQAVEFAIQGEETCNRQNRGDCGPTVFERNLQDVQAIGVVCVNSLKCPSSGSTTELKIGAIEAVTDVIRTVVEIVPTERTIILNESPRHAVEDTEAYHSNKRAIQEWLNRFPRDGAGESREVAELYVPPGTYIMAQNVNDGFLAIPNHTHIHCAPGVIFKNSGRSRTGLSKMFTHIPKFTRTVAATDILIDGCAFDANGWNPVDFFDILAFGGTQSNPANNITVTRNHFFDSQIPSNDPNHYRLAGCFQGQDACTTLQRHYINISRADGVRVTDNTLEGGGRIKVGGPGRNILIARNSIGFVNDNAITVVDQRKPGGRNVLERHQCLNNDCVNTCIWIEGNRITGPVGVGIFFGSDGGVNDHDRMKLRDLFIRKNIITGGFYADGIRGILPARTNNVLIEGNVLTAERYIPFDSKVDSRNRPRGIAISRGRAHDERPARHIAIRQNAVFAKAPKDILRQGLLDAALRFSPPITNVDVFRNYIECVNCFHSDNPDWDSDDPYRDRVGIQNGIVFSTGKADRPHRFDDVHLAQNTIREVGVAVRLAMKGTFTDLTIQDNTLERSLNPQRGQLSVERPRGVTFSNPPVVLNNRIWGGRNRGICGLGNDSPTRLELENDNDFGVHLRWAYLFDFGERVPNGYYPVQHPDFPNIFGPGDFRIEPEWPDCEYDPQLLEAVG